MEEHPQEDRHQDRDDKTIENHVDTRVNATHTPLEVVYASLDTVNTRNHSLNLLVQFGAKDREFGPKIRLKIPQSAFKRGHTPVDLLVAAVEPRYAVCEYGRASGNEAISRICSTVGRPNLRSTISRYRGLEKYT